MLHDGIDDDDDVLEGDETINIMKLSESREETATLNRAKELLQADAAFSGRVDKVIFGFVFSPPHRFTVSPMVHGHETWQGSKGANNCPVVWGARARDWCPWGA